MKSGATCIAYETVTARAAACRSQADVGSRGPHGGAGRRALSEKQQGGRGILLGGVPGVAGQGRDPGRRRLGRERGADGGRLRADVTIYDINNDRLAELDMFFSSQIKTAYASKAAIAAAVKNAHLVIGAVLVPGAAAPKLVTRDMLKTMKRGSVMVDIAIDQGGCFETSHATTHQDPVFEVDGVIHYCVANMPGAVARTSTFALNNATTCPSR